MNSRVQSQFLFVYGTLLKGAENMMSSYLKSKTQFIGEAIMHGHLYKVDFFPGAVYDPQAEGIVLGELYELPDPSPVLEVLDTYEGYTPHQPDQSLFQRVMVEVFSGEETYTSWAYLYGLPTDHLLKITSGDFLQFDMESHSP